MASPATRGAPLVFTCSFGFPAPPPLRVFCAAAAGLAVRPLHGFPLRHDNPGAEAIGHSASLSFRRHKRHSRRLACQVYRCSVRDGQFRRPVDKGEEASVDVEENKGYPVRFNRRAVQHLKDC